MNPKFLIAHPDTLTVSAIEVALRDAHYSAHITHEGLDVIDRALDEKPDAIVLGLDLPGLSGLDVARALRALEPTKDIPILFVARDSEEAAAVVRANLPQVQVLMGPIDFLSFREEMARLLRSRRPLPDLLTADSDDHITAITDQLTGLYSRHYMLHRLAYEAARAARYRTPVACLLFGVEKLDDIIRDLGPGSADKLLVEMAGLFKRSSRSSDVVGRGDKCEFLMVAPQTDEWGAQRTAVRLRVILREHYYDFPAPYDRLDMAVGYAAALGGSVSENLALLARAEGALTQAEADPQHKIASG
ncbi:MAG: diguanylate cyclase [Anaerolineae bacterium]